MKRRTTASRSMTPRLKAPRRSGAGAATSAGKKRPTPGWKGWGHLLTRGWRNPRTPSVPATLDLTLDEYFAATSLMGLIASQAEEPDHRWCCDWSFKMGKTMAREARKRRRKP